MYRKLFQNIFTLALKLIWKIVHIQTSVQKDHFKVDYFFIDNICVTQYTVYHRPQIW